MPSETLGLESSLLAAHILGRSRSWILTHPEFKLEPDAAVKLNGLLERLVSGEPLAYLTGKREFFGLEFTVTPHVLIPRPETELLVEHAIAWLRIHPARHAAVDVGCGSGCIAVSLAKHISDLCVTAVDVSPAALQVTQGNSAFHQVSDQLQIVCGDLLTTLPGPFDLVCANLPYIPSADVHSLAVGHFEPHLALDGGADGLDLIRRLLAQLPSRLAAGSLALLEIEYRQGPDVCALACAALPEAQVTLIPDLAGLDRLVQIQMIE